MSTLMSKSDSSNGGRAPLFLSYVLITPARNEIANIERTIKSVIGQTIRPLKWIIVSDGSTDGTDDVVKKYAREHPWIELERRPERAERHFGGKADCFNAGYARVTELPFDIVGNLDADLSFDGDYFSYLIERFAENPKLGVAGTPFIEGNASYDFRFASLEHVSGACQLFRRRCFEEIGGYVPLKVGGIDLVAVITARMNGWETRTFTGKTCEHHRKTQCGKHAGWQARFRSGYHDYLMGVHPAWQFFRCIYQLRNSPLLIGGSLLFFGYSWALLTRAERPVSRQLVAFRQHEQMCRLRGIFFGWLTRPLSESVRS